MRLVITTPLYPPDTGALGGYVKELAKQLRKHHMVRVVTYGSLPEKVEGVDIVTVQKHTPLFWRTVSFFITLWKSSAESDMIYICDGASVGLASMLVSKLRKIPCIRLVHNTEIAERLHAQRSPFSTHIDVPLTWKLRIVQWLEGVVARHATILVTLSPHLAEAFSTLHAVERARIQVVTRVIHNQQQLPFNVSHDSVPACVLRDDNLTKDQALDIVRTCEELARTQTPIHLYTFGVLRPEVIDCFQATTHITYLGHVSSAEAWARHTQAHATIIIEPQDAYQSVFASYEASTPVVNFSTNTNNYLSEADTVHAVPTFTQEALVQHIKSLVETQDLTSLRTAARERYQAQASWEQHVAALERLQSNYGT